MRHKVLRPLLAVVLALGLSSTLTPTSAAQPSITTGPDDSASARANAEQEAIDNAAEAAATPAPGREDLEPAEPGFDDNTIDNDAGADWHATTDPEATITPGQMRSDTEDIPGGFTKEEADRAEVQEAAEQQAQQDRATNPLARALAAEPVNCTTYWPSPYKVCGAIREKYDAIGGPTSFLTWPKSDELGVPDGVGRRNEFVNGFIYWHPTTGAHPITGDILDQWADQGYEGGNLGYPIEDAQTQDSIKYEQKFSGGSIFGYGSPIPELMNKLDMDGDNIEAFYTQIRDLFVNNGVDVATGFFDALTQANESIQASNDEIERLREESSNSSPQNLLRAIDSGMSNDCSPSQLIKPGNSRTNRGDIFYSGATTTVKGVDINHGHMGSFVGNSSSDPNKIETVEAVGKTEGVRRISGSERRGVCAPKYLSVDTTGSNRTSAAQFAISKVGSSYNSNFAGTRATTRQSASFNCSSLVWAAYMSATNGKLDIGTNKYVSTYRAGVYPIDIYNSINVTEFK
ncbi:MAG: hypothetical protein ACTIIQ_10730 [Corynebacterium variabile]|uniref:hypothetical protein n=1 Tax=Corynebacterium variabile TaxID=1727 RepID=UPI003F9CA11E